MKKHILIPGALILACAPVAWADTNDVPVNSLLVLAQASSTDSGNDTMPPDGSQGNNATGNNNNTNANQQPSNYNNQPVEYLVPINPAPFHNRTTVNVEGTTGTSRTGANPEGAGR